MSLEKQPITIRIAKKLVRSVLYGVKWKSTISALDTARSELDTTRSILSSRINGDLYKLTRQALQALYNKVSLGGNIIVDDYHVVKGCKTAVHDFFLEQNISPELVEIDGVGVYWKKQ